MSREDAEATLRYCERMWSEERGVMIDKLMAAREALSGMLLHSCVADSAPEDKFPEDHEAERAARRVIEGLGGWMDIRTAPQDVTHILVRSEGTMSPPTVAHWFGPPGLPGLRAGGWYLSVQQLEGPAIHPTHWRHVPS